MTTPPSTTTVFDVVILWASVPDPVRARRLAALLFAGSTGSSTGGTA